jgi:hypothetical protein
VQHCYWNIINLPDRLMHVRDSANADERSLSRVSQEDRTEVKRLLSTVSRATSVGDAIVTYAPLGTTPVPEISLCEILLAYGWMMLKSLASGYAMRGALELGWGAEIPAGGLYGPVTARAHYLESHVAQYPRIVVGERLMRHVAASAADQGETPQAAGSQSMALVFSSIVGEDLDGWPFVDYLGGGFKKFYWKHENTVAEAFAFVESELRRLRLAGDAKLVARYKRLRDYFLSRAYLWPKAIPPVSGSAE